MKFVMSYSCGKDSTLALHKLIKRGDKPVALLVIMNSDAERSFFHGADKKMLDRYSVALEIPLILCDTNGEDYHVAMENGLLKAVELGAEYACFGDIDIETNRKWAKERCNKVGLKPIFPLWNHSREENVYELIDEGYSCLIKTINKNLLPIEILGKIIDQNIIAIMKNCGIDLCGENGEYHTLVVDGPIFKEPIKYETGKVLEFGEYPAMEIIID